jgi:hypothetical protein
MPFPRELVSQRSSESAIEYKKHIVVSPDSSSDPGVRSKINFKLNGSGVADLANSEFQFNLTVPKGVFLNGSAKSCYSEVTFRNKNNEVLDRVAMQNVVSRVVDTLCVDRNKREALEQLKSGSSRVGVGKAFNTSTEPSEAEFSGNFSISMVSQFMSLRDVDLDLTGQISAELIVNSYESALYQEASNVPAVNLGFKITDPRWIVPVSTVKLECMDSWNTQRDTLGRLYEYPSFSVSQIPMGGASTSDRLVVENSYQSLRGFMLVCRKPSEISKAANSDLRFIRPDGLKQIRVRLGNKTYEPILGSSQELYHTSYFWGKNWDSSILNSNTYMTSNKTVDLTLDDVSKRVAAEYFSGAPASWIFGFSFESSDDQPQIDNGDSSRGRLEITLDRKGGSSGADDLEYTVILCHNTKWEIDPNGRQVILT